MIPIVAYILGFGAYEGFHNNQKESSTRRGVLLNADRSSALSFIYSPRSYDITKENLHPLKRGGGLSRILRARRVDRDLRDLTRKKATYDGSFHAINSFPIPERARFAHIVPYFDYIALDFDYRRGRALFLLRERVLGEFVSTPDGGVLLSGMDG